MKIANEIYCGCSTNHGHGDYSICGRNYRGEIYQCDSCSNKEKSSLIDDMNNQINALVAENVALKSAISEIDNSAEEAEIDRYLTFTVNPDCIHSAIDLIDGGIPATDAAVRELMARGVDEFSSSIGAEYSKLKPSSITAKAIKATVLRATKFAQRLREGGV